MFPTNGENVLTSKARAYVSALEQCNHEEVDSLIMIYVLDASLHGHPRRKIGENDTGFVVLGVSNDPTLTWVELWISFGSSKQVRYLPKHAIATSLDREKADLLRKFQALETVETVSAFSRRGMRTAWNVWNMFPELTPVLKALLISREDTDDTCFDVIERFLILSYDRTSTLRKGNEVRQELFSGKARPLNQIPST